MSHSKLLAVLILCYLESRVDSKNGSLHKCSIIEITQNKDTKHEQSTSSVDITGTEITHGLSSSMATVMGATAWQKGQCK